MSKILTGLKRSVEWPRVHLGEVANYHNGRAFKPEDWATAGIPIIRIQNLNTPSAVYNYFKGKIDSRNAVNDGDLLISWSASLDAFMWDRGTAVLNQHIFKVEEDKEKIDRHYLYFAIKEAMAEIRNQVHGATMQHITKPEFEAIKIPLPTYIEQKHIAAILSEKMAVVEKARAAAEARLNAAKELPAAYLREVFESEEAQRWSSNRLGDLATVIQNGIYKSAEHYGHGQPFIRMYNLPNSHWKLNLETLAQVSLDDSEKQRFVLHKDDLLVSRVNSFELVGKCSWVGQEADGYAFENMLIRVRFGNDTDPKFVAQQFGTSQVRQQIEKVAKRAIGQASINSEDLRSLELLFPPIDEQRRLSRMIEEKTSASANLCSSIESELGAIKEIPAALLRQAFAGEL